MVAAALAFAAVMCQTSRISFARFLGSCYSFPCRLTDVQKRPAPQPEEEAEPLGDEDGPPSDYEIGPADHEADDSDPMSSGQEEGKADKAGVGLAPKLYWRNRPGHMSSPPALATGEVPRPVVGASLAFAGYFERQRAALCGMHALNNALGHPFATEDDMTFACDTFLLEAEQEAISLLVLDG